MSNCCDDRYDSEGGNAVHGYLMKAIVASGCGHSKPFRFLRFAIRISTLTRSRPMDGGRICLDEFRIKATEARMITKITGKLVGLSGADASIRGRARLNMKCSFRSSCGGGCSRRSGRRSRSRRSEHIDGNPQKGGRMVPRLVGFQNAVEREFFEMISLCRWGRGPQGAQCDGAAGAGGGGGD